MRVQHIEQESADLLCNAGFSSAKQLYHLDLQDERTVETTTLDELINSFGVPALIKIDVVGFELEVLQGLHRPVPCISFEIGLPEFKQELPQCIELLGRLSIHGRLNYTWDHRNGLCLDPWIETEEFIKILKDFREGPLEVFWKCPCQ